MTDASLFKKQRHSDRAVYIVYVLWLIGYTQTTIGSVLGLRRKQVAGIIENSDYRNRAGMSEDEIVRRLAELEAIRFGDDGAPLDGGALNKIAFRPLRLGARQRRGPLKRGMRRG